MSRADTAIQMPDEIREKELLAIARGEARYHKTTRGARVEHTAPQASGHFADQVRSLAFEPQLHLVALSCWHLLWCAQSQEQIAAAGDEGGEFGEPQRDGGNGDPIAGWRDWPKLLGLTPTEFRRAVDGRIAPDLLERRIRRRTSAVTIVAAVLPTLPEPVLRLALQRISATSGFAPDDEGDFFDSFRAVWREAEALSSRHDRGHLRAPIGLLRIVSEALDFRPDERLYVPEAADGFAAADLYERVAVSGERWRTSLSVANAHFAVVAASRFNLVWPEYKLEIKVRASWLSEPLEGGADLVYCDQPWGGKAARDSAPDSVPIPTSDTELLQFQHAVLSLRPKGRAAIVMPQGFAFKKGATQLVREWLLSNYRLDAVVELPAGTWRPAVGAASVLLFVRRLPPAETVLFLTADLHRADLGKQISYTPSEKLLTAVLRARLDTGNLAALDDELSNWIAEDLTPTESRLVSLAKYLHLVGDGADPSFPELVPVAEILRRNAELLWKESRQRPLAALLHELAAARPKTAIVPLREVAEVLGGATYKVSDFVEPIEGTNYWPKDAVGLARVSDFPRFAAGEENVRPLERVKRKVKYFAPKNASRCLRANDVLLSIDGTIGRVSTFGGGVEEPTMAANGLAIIRSPDSLTSAFLAKLFTTEPYQRWFRGEASGSTIQHLQLSRLRDLPVPTLPPAELAALASELETGGTEERLKSLFTRQHAFSDLEGRLRESRSVTSFAELSADDLQQPRALQVLKWARDEIASWQREHRAERQHEWADAFEVLRELSAGLLEALDLPETSDRFNVLQAWRASADDRGRDVRRVRNMVAHRGVGKSAELMIADRTDRFVANLLRLSQIAMERQLADVRVTASVSPALIVAGKPTELTFSVRSDGSLPLRNFGAMTTSVVNTVTRVPLLPSGASESWGQAVTLDEPGRRPVTLIWTAHRLDGQLVSETIELAIEVEPAGSSMLGEALGESPYVYARVIDERSDAVFFGRSNALTRLEATLRKSGATTICLVEGNRRIGKTSLLGYFVRHRLPAGWVPVFVNFQDFEGDTGCQARPGIPTRNVFTGMARALAGAVAAALPGEELPGLGTPPARTSLDFGRWLRCSADAITADAPFASFKDLFLALRERVKPRRLVLLLDEFDRLQEGIESGVTSDQVPENLRHLFQTCGDVAGIFTGSRTIRRLREEYWNVLFGLGETVRLSGLEAAEAAALIEKPVQGRLVYSPDAVAAIIFLTARQPLLIQGICDRLFQLCSERGERGVTAAMVEEVAAERAADSEHFETLWGYIKSDRQRFVVFLLEKRENEATLVTMVADPYSLVTDPVSGKLTLLENRYPGATFDDLQDVAEEAGIRFTARELDATLDDLLDLEVIGKIQRDGIARYRIEVPLFAQWLRLNKDFSQYRRAALEEE